MINECLMFLRRGGGLKIVEEKYADEVAVDESFTGKMAADELYRLVLDLPPGYRTVFNLYVIEGFAHKEIAAMLQITEGASKSQLSKARDSLRHKVEKVVKG
jgi:RNA polymerase sigma-70 factor (ECF subfamily)